MKTTLTAKKMTKERILISRGEDLKVGSDVWAFGSRDVVMEGTIININNRRADVQVGKHVWRFDFFNLAPRYSDEA